MALFPYFFDFRYILGVRGPIGDRFGLISAHVLALWGGTGIETERPEVVRGTLSLSTREWSGKWSPGEWKVEPW